MKKVLLINPLAKASTPIIPLGLAYIAAYLEKNSVEVEVIDAWAEGYDEAQLGKEIEKRKPDIVGVTLTSPNYGVGMRTAALAKQKTGGLVVVGGAHPSALPQECLEDNADIDVVVVGEGEKTMLSLVRALEHSECFDPIQGIVFRKDGKIISTGHSPRIDFLDDLPYPARHLFPLEKYQTHPPYGKKNPYMTMITSRGCPYKCTYCSDSIFGKKHMARTPGNVVDEIEYIINKYNVKEIHFYDDDFTIDMKRAAQICDEIISRKIKISWSCTTRVDLVDKELLQKMKKAGCWLISYGIESASPEILKKIRKGYTVDRIRESVRLTKKLGIRTLGFFMIGLPDDTRKTIEETIQFSKEIDPDFVSWSITSLFPGSRLYDDVQEKLTGENKQIRYSFQKEEWHKSISPYDDGFFIIYEENIAREELKAYSERANKQFYFRPSYLIKFLFKLRSWNEFIYYAKGGLELIFWLFAKKTPPPIIDQINRKNDPTLFL